MDCLIKLTNSPRWVPFLWHRSDTISLNLFSVIPQHYSKYLGHTKNIIHCTVMIHLQTLIPIIALPVPKKEAGTRAVESWRPLPTSCWWHPVRISPMHRQQSRCMFMAAYGVVTCHLLQDTPAPCQSSGSRTLGHRITRRACGNRVLLGPHPRVPDSWGLGGTWNWYF